MVTARYFYIWRKGLQRACFLSLLIWLIVAFSTQLHAQSTKSGAGYDPLTAEEVQTALDAAFAAGAAAGADSINAASILKQEVLLVERHQESKAEKQSGNARRRSDAYIYDYTTNTLKHVVVDLATQEVEVIEELRGVQLPLTGNEITQAYYLAFSHPILRQQLDELYLEVAGEALANVAQLDIKAFIFTVDAMPDVVNQYSEECGIHRCAQLQFYTKENTILDIQPIIDLSRRMVVQDITGGIKLVDEVEAVDPDLDTENDNDPVDAAELESDNGQESDEQFNDSNANANDLFLPFVSRRFLKEALPRNELILDRVLFAWWCEWMSDSQYADGAAKLCAPQEVSE